MQSVFVFYRTQIIFDIFMNCNAEIAISCSEKKFLKNSEKILGKFGHFGGVWGVKGVYECKELVR